MPSVTLQKPEDKATIKKVLAGNKILIATVARLYVAYPDPNAWTYTKIMGAVAFVKDNSKNSFFFKLVDVTGDRGILWEQELYKDFKYTEELAFFHTFALDEYHAAFSFASEQEAKVFYKKVMNREKLSSKSKKSRKEKENKNFFGKKKKEKGKIDKSDISGPTEFRHLGHIGWDEQKGFDVQNINPEWKDLIDQLGDHGVSKEQIAKNVEFINSFLEKNKKEPRRSSAAPKKGPPPPPPSRRGAPQPTKNKKSPPPPPPVRKPATPTRDNNNTFQPSSPLGVRHSVSPPVSPSILPKMSHAPPPPISAPVPPPPPILPSRQQPVIVPPPPPPPVRPTSSIAPPPIPPARVTNPSSVPPPLPQSRHNTNVPSPPPSIGGPPPPPPPPPPGGVAPPPPPPPPPPQIGGSVPPPPPPPPPQIGGSAPPPPPPPPAAPQQGLPPAADSRVNLMEAIRNKGGVSGAGLKSVGEPVRQSTFTEEPSSPGNDSNLAKTLADALKKLNKDMGSDDSDIEEDDEWDTD